MDDEEIQRLIEQQLKGIQVSVNLENDKDTKLYRLLFTELSHDPSILKDSPLAQSVVHQIQMEQEKWEHFYYTLIIAAVAIFIGSLTYLALAMNNSNLLNIIGQFLISNKTVCLFIMVCFCLIQVLDKYLVKKNEQFS